MDDATVEILINVRERGRENFTQAQAGLDLLRRAVEKFAQAETDGMTATFAMREALKSLRDQLLEAGVSAEGQKVAINQARDAMLAYNAAVAGGLPWDAALSASLAEQSGEFEGQAAATDTATASQQAFNLSMLAGLNPMGNWIKAAIEAAVVLAPFALLLAASVVIMSAFAVGATGMALALAGATGMFLAIGAAILLLTDKMGWINNSMATFKTHLREVGDHLARLAAPAANSIMKFLDSLLPLAQSAGSSIIEWFSARLPLALASMHQAITALTPDLNSFAQFLGAMFEKLSPEIVPMFEEIARFGIGALQGLIGNLVALGEWFQARLPTYGPIVAQIFGAVGTAVQFVATQFGHLSDWLVKNWPSITANAKAFADGLSQGFNALNASFGPKSGVDWTGLFRDLGTVLGALAAAVLDVGRAFLSLGIIWSQVQAALLPALRNIGDAFYADVEEPILSGINAIIEAVNALPGPIKAMLGISGNVPLIDLSMSRLGVLPGQGGAANPGAGRSGGPQTSPGGPSGRTSGHKITIHVSGASSPQVTASTIARNLRKIGVV